jgi:type VI secretion system secreted protein VgrG
MPRSRRTRLHHRPHLEHLDDRCLLSTGLTHPAYHLAVPGHHRPSGLVHQDRPAGSGHRIAMHRHGAVGSGDRERPSGTLTPGATGSTVSYDPAIGASQVRSAYQVNGTGMTVAVIDTGVDYDNPALGGSFGPGARVIAGFDFADNAADPMATTSQHGTAVAGLIASADPSDEGVAPGVNIVALRVTDNTNTASLTSIAAALQWVIDHHSQYNITAVNMSLSDGRNYAQDWFAQGGGVPQQVTDLIGRLTAMNIPVVAATGNSFNQQQGEGFTAIDADTISVTATDLSGHLLSNAQRLGSAIGGASATTIAAPGAGFTAPSGASGTTTVDGTSFATPLVTGSVVLLQQIYQARFGTLPTVAQLKSWLVQGSDPVSDPVTGITIGQLDLPKAAALIPQPSPPAPAPVATQAHSVTTPAAIPTASAPATTRAPAFAPATATNAPSASPAQGTPAATTWNNLLGANALSFWAASNASGVWASGSSHVRVWNA